MNWAAGKMRSEHLREHVTARQGEGAHDGGDGSEFQIVQSSPRSVPGGFLAHSSSSASPPLGKTKKEEKKKKDDDEELREG